MPPSKEVSHAVKDTARALRRNSRRAAAFNQEDRFPHYGNVIKANPLRVELHDSDALLDEDDLNLAQEVRRYDDAQTLQPGDTLLVHPMQDGHWVATNVLSDDAVDPGGSGTAFTAGDGLTLDTGPDPDVLNVGAGYGIDVDASNVAVDPTEINLNEWAAPDANVAMGGFKLTGLAAGTTAGDSLRYEQLPTSLPPSGSAGGDLEGSYPNPTLNNGVTQTWTVDQIISSAGKDALQLTASGGGITFGGDANLYRGAADRLQTDDDLIIGSSGIERWLFMYGGAGGGKINWGDGAGNLIDTNLYRSAADTLKTDDKFIAALGLDSGDQKITNVANGTASDDAAAYGQLPDMTNVAYKNASNTFTLEQTISYTLSTGNMGGNAGLTVSNAGQEAGIVLDPGGTGVSYVVNADDGPTNGFRVWRDVAGVWTNHLQLNSDGRLNIPTVGSIAGIMLGGDANLYRSAADTLKTDDKFVAALGLDSGDQKITNVLTGTASDDGANVGQLGAAVTNSLARIAALGF